MLQTKDSLYGDNNITISLRMIKKINLNDLYLDKYLSIIYKLKSKFFPSDDDAFHDSDNN